MRIFVVIATVFAAVSLLVSVFTGCADAATKKKHPKVQRSAAGTVIQPTRTIIHHEDGTTTVIVVPRRSYLDTGTEVSVGDRGFEDYAFPPDGDPGRPYWIYGPDHRGAGYFPIPPPMYVPGWNPNTPN